MNNTIIIHEHEYGCGGIGDFLRGALTLYSICKKYNYKYYIYLKENINLDKCFIKEKIPLNIINDNNKENINIIDKYEDNVIINFLNKIKNNKKVYFVKSNYFSPKYKESINNIKDEFFTNVLKPTQEILNIVNNIYLQNNIKKNEYVSVHIRSGDYNMSNNSSRDLRINLSNKNIYLDLNNKIQNILKKHNINIPILIHSDSLKLKNELKNINNNYIICDLQIKHIAEKIGIDTEEAVIDTIAEFYIVANANKIIMYPSYSGFSHIASLINNAEIYSDNHPFFEYIPTNHVQI